MKKQNITGGIASTTAELLEQIHLHDSEPYMSFGKIPSRVKRRNMLEIGQSTTGMFFWRRRAVPHQKSAI